MTLIVARIIEDEIVVLADAKITNPSILRNNPLTGALKLIATNDVCIGYAGSYCVALDAIRDIRARNTTDVGEIEDILFAAHTTSNMEADFIIASHIQGPRLTAISNSSVSTGNSAAWIGDINAFTAYQRQYHNISTTDEDSRMNNAMNEIIREGIFSSVGNFVTGVRGTSSGFRYCSSIQIFPISQTIPSGSWTTIQFGSAQQGGYAYSIMIPLTPNTGVIGVYFFQGRVGALYHPIEQDHAIIYSNVNFEEFKEAVYSDYGLQIDGGKIL